MVGCSCKMIPLVCRETQLACQFLCLIPFVLLGNQSVCSSPSPFHFFLRQPCSVFEADHDNRRSSFDAFCSCIILLLPSPSNSPVHPSAFPSLLFSCSFFCSLFASSFFCSSPSPWHFFLCFPFSSFALTRAEKSSIGL